MTYIPYGADELDDKDIAILLALVKDARTPFSSLAETIGLSVSSISQRVTKLEETKIIKSYKLVLNHKAFPYDEFDLYYVLADVSAFTVKSAMKYLSECPFTTQVLSTMGSADIRVTILARNMHHLQEVLEEVEQHFSANIKSRTILAVTRKFKSKAESFLSAIFKRTIIFPPKQKMSEVYEQASVTLDGTDSKIIRELAKDPRASYAAIAKQVSLTPEGVSARVKSLEDKQIILGYKALLDGPRLGYRWAVLMVNLRHLSSTQRDGVFSYVQEHTNVTSAVETLGPYNLSITLFGQTLDSLHQTELDFRSKFAEQVTDTALLFILENEKYPDLADGILPNA